MYLNTTIGGSQNTVQQNIVIVGAGIVGLATAYALLSQGATHVTVLEQASVDHPRSPSRGLSRLLRFEYGADLFYSEMVRLSLQRWKKLSQHSSQTLYTPTQVLLLGKEGDNFTQVSYHVLRELGLPIRPLSRENCKQLFPQFNLQPYDLYTYNTEAAILYASSSLQTLRKLILDLGGSIYEETQVSHLSYDNPHLPLRLYCKNGTIISADRVVVATGCWIHHLLKELHLPIRITRQHLLYFADLPQKTFGLHAFPAFLTEDLYGFPLHNSCAGWGPSWLKVASHKFGMSIDPDAEPIINQHAIDCITEKACNILPALRAARLAHVDACMYDVSPDEDFILDYHPADTRIVFATGMTGHGFKFGLLLGELLSSLVRGTQPVVPMERFRLARFSPQKQRLHSSISA